MIDENEIVAEQQEVVVNHDEVIAQLKADMAKMQQDMQAVVKKKDQLLDEKKKVSQNAEHTQKSLEQQLNELKSSIKDEKIQANALRIASELAEGHNVKLLAKFIQDDLKNMMEDDGALSADVLSNVKNNYIDNVEYKSLLKQSKAAGGGAVGNVNRAEPQKLIERHTFDSWDNQRRTQYLKSGGKLQD